MPASLLSLGFHAIADASYGADEALTASGIDFGSNQAYEHFERVRLNIRVAAPNPSDDGIASLYGSRSPHEKFEQSKLGASECDGCTCTADLGPCSIQDQ